ncbi:MAG: glutathione S-transferase family protein [Pseudomonadota bacterium]|nr:glutathione S-transferase family protein [Pseudomonadota bacterium]
MILVGQYDSPYVRRVAISLKLAGLQFSRDTRSVFADAEEMRRINPLGRIPSLVLDDGEVLIDSGAILDYIDELIGPERSLLPAHGASRRKALRIIALATGAIDKAGAVAYERMLRPPETIYMPWIGRCLTQLASALAALDALPLTPWYFGARPMQPDITVGVMLGYLELRVADAFPAGRYPALETLTAACQALPEFAATAPAADETMPSRGTGVA